MKSLLIAVAAMAVGSAVASPADLKISPFVTGSLKKRQGAATMVNMVINRMYIQSFSSLVLTNISQGWKGPGSSWSCTKTS